MKKITIQTADGAEVRTSGNLKVVAGAGASVEVKDGRLVVSRIAPDGWKEAYYRENFNAIYDHRHGEAEVPGVQGLMDTFAFAAPTEGDPPGPNSGIPADDGYWIGRINGVWGFHNHLSVTGGPTFRWEPAWKDGSCNGIRIDDIGRPDLDCGDYLKLAEYVRKLAAAYDGLKTQILGDPASGPGVEGLPGRYAKIYGFHKQYEATLMLWNYLVYVSSVVFNASFQQRALFLQGKFINSTDHAIALGDVTLSCRLLPGVSEVTAIEGKLFPTIRAESSITDSDLAWQGSPTAEGEEPGQPFTSDVAAAWELTPGVYDIQPQEEVEFLARIDFSWDEEDDIKGASVETVMSWSVPMRLPDGTESVLITRRRIVPLHNPTTSLTVEDVSQTVTVGWSEESPVIGEVTYGSSTTTISLVAQRSAFGLIIQGYAVNGGESDVDLGAYGPTVTLTAMTADVSGTATSGAMSGFSTLPSSPSWSASPTGTRTLNTATPVAWTISQAGSYLLTPGHSASFVLPVALTFTAGTPESFTLKVDLAWTIGSALTKSQSVVYVK